MGTSVGDGSVGASVCVRVLETRYKMYMLIAAADFCLQLYFPFNDLQVLL